MQANDVSQSTPQVTLLSVMLGSSYYEDICSGVGGTVVQSLVLSFNSK